MVYFAHPDPQWYDAMLQVRDKYGTDTVVRDLPLSVHRPTALHEELSEERTVGYGRQHMRAWQR